MVEWQPVKRAQEIIRSESAFPVHHTLADKMWSWSVIIHVRRGWAVTVSAESWMLAKERESFKSSYSVKQCNNYIRLKQQLLRIHLFIYFVSSSRIFLCLYYSFNEIVFFKRNKNLRRFKLGSAICNLHERTSKLLQTFANDLSQQKLHRSRIWSKPWIATSLNDGILCACFFRQTCGFDCTGSRRWIGRAINKSCALRSL